MQGPRAVTPELSPDCEPPFAPLGDPNSTAVTMTSISVLATRIGLSVVGGSDRGPRAQAATAVVQAC